VLGDLLFTAGERQGDRQLFGRFEGSLDATRTVRSMRADRGGDPGTGR
jgi:hypothetical protein